MIHIVHRMFKRNCHWFTGPSMRGKKPEEAQRLALEDLQAEEADLVRRSRDAMIDQIQDQFPLAYLRTDLAKIPSRKGACAVGEWLDGDQSRGLGLVGGTGVGKTRCALDLARRYLLKASKTKERRVHDDYVCAEIGWPNFIAINMGVEFQKIVRQAADFQTQDRAQALLNRMSDCDLLILDDLGAGKMSDAAAASIFDIVENRTSEELPIIFTSQFSGAELAVRFADENVGVAVVRRLKDFSDVIQCEIDPADEVVGDQVDEVKLRT